MPAGVNKSYTEKCAYMFLKILRIPPCQKDHMKINTNRQFKAILQNTFQTTRNEKTCHTGNYSPIHINN